MDGSVVHNLREWAPLILLEKIPTRILNGLFPSDLNITCIDAIQQYLVLGTNVGLVYWYNRFSDEYQKLRVEISSPITCVKIVSSVEYMIAVGTRNGQVNVFQIQKEIPQGLNLSAPLAKTKPIQRYSIKELHESAITCCEWSKNGMKLFSADKNGLLVLTEFDFQNNLSKSIDILNENSSIIQINLYQTYLLVSSLQRTVICQQEGNMGGYWEILQVGESERKCLGEFGAIFQINENKSPKIIACRPGFRFWLADCSGVVEKTFIFKDAPLMIPSWEIPLLNPNRKSINIRLQNFTCIYPFLQNFYVTNDDNSIYILNLEDLKIEAIARNFRQIIDYAICDNEIFILEGGRSLIRLSNKPEPPSQKAKIIFNPLLPPPIPQMGIFESALEFKEGQNDIGVEECFESAPIEPISLNIPIQTHIGSPDMAPENDHFQEIGKQDFEEKILFRRTKEYKIKKSKKKKKVGEENKHQSYNIYVEDTEIQKIANKTNYFAPENQTKSNKVEKEEEQKKDIQATISSQFSELSLLNYPLLESSKIEMENCTKILNESVEKSDNLIDTDLTSDQKYLIKNDISPNQLIDETTTQKTTNALELEKICNIIDIDPNRSVKNSDENDSIDNDISKNQISYDTPTKESETDPKFVKSLINDISPDLGGRGNQLKLEDMPQNLIIPSIFETKTEIISSAIDTGRSESKNSNTSEWEIVNNTKTEDKTDG